MENFFANFPRYGKKFSTLWKTVPVLAVLILAGCGKTDSSLPALPAGQDLAVSATLSTNRIRIGDPVELVVTVLHREGTSVEFPSIAQGQGHPRPRRRRPADPPAQRRAEDRPDPPLHVDDRHQPCRRRGNLDHRVHARGAEVDGGFSVRGHRGCFVACSRGSDPPPRQGGLGALAHPALALDLDRAGAPRAAGRSLRRPAQIPRPRRAPSSTCPRRFRRTKPPSTPSTRCAPRGGSKP
jgi:hypothetical protein